MLKEYKPVVVILVRFVVLYVVLLFLYQSYLNYFDTMGLDPYSRFIVEQVQYMQNSLGYATALYDDPKNNQIYFNVKGIYVTRMLEGCNSISILILFVAFIFAFYSGKKTFLYVALSLVFLYLMNLVRIIALNIISIDYPSLDKWSHDYFFPAFIYGFVVLLWLVWIKYFALKK